MAASRIRSKSLRSHCPPFVRRDEGARVAPSARRKAQVSSSGHGNPYTHRSLLSADRLLHRDARHWRAVRRDHVCAFDLAKPAGRIERFARKRRIRRPFEAGSRCAHRHRRLGGRARRWTTTKPRGACTGDRRGHRFRGGAVGLRRFRPNLNGRTSRRNRPATACRRHPLPIHPWRARGRPRPPARGPATCIDLGAARLFLG